MATRLHKLAAAAFGLWGLFSLALGMIFLMMSLFGPDDVFAFAGIPGDTSAHARALMMQNNVSLAAGGLVVLVAALRFGWRSPTRAYWVMLGVSSLFTFETVAFEVVPGHLGLQEVGAHLLLWATGSVLGAVAYVRARSTTETRDPPDVDVAD